MVTVPVSKIVELRPVILVPTPKSDEAIPNSILNFENRYLEPLPLIVYRFVPR